MDNAMCLGSEEYTDFYSTYGINISYSSPYHPQGNGQTKSINKSLLKIIKRTLEKNKNAQDSKLKAAIWANRITVKKAIGKSPFELVYGTQVKLPMNNFFPVYKYIQENEWDIPEPMEERMEQFVELDEIINDAHKINMKLQQ
ncbi:uncharacterized protein LOC131038627 [Cryptomeria japonica]|uniref:uncharacterized protein LOC131038627 n=1 Tax=Cryptomeria japonica TaxID=3369 RepID=UPI0027DA1A4C|nr:uncharacterized protein LOC131038627 [Cryptomeria japonica]